MLYSLPKDEITYLRGLARRQATRKRRSRGPLLQPLPTVVIFCGSTGIKPLGRE